jgi:Ca2+/H+ antiporter
VVPEIGQDGKSNWLEGVNLLGLYAIIAISFYFLCDHQAAPA